MIYEVTGDVLMTKAAAIAHAIGPNDHFDHGLALALRGRWPMLAKDFRHYSHQCHPKPGDLWTWGTGSFWIFNLITHDDDHSHGKKPGKDAIVNTNHALRKLRHELEREKIRSLAIPNLITDVVGGDWDHVLPLVRNHLGDLSIPIYVYTHDQKGVHAEEPDA